jgi:threonine dehydratase
MGQSAHDTTAVKPGTDGRRQIRQFIFYVSSDQTPKTGKPIATVSTTTIADDVACRVPEPRAVEIINRYAERIVQVSEAEIRAAMRHYFTDTHNVAEGAGAAPLAALLKEPEEIRGRRVGLVLTGGNVDRSVFVDILSGDEP